MFLSKTPKSLRKKKTNKITKFANLKKASLWPLELSLFQ